MRVSEGAVELAVPEQPDEGVGDAVFYNPEQELNRDLTVATLRALRERTDAESYLDAMAATGIRGVRAAAEGWDATLCDRDPAAVELCEGNLERNGLEARVVQRDANAFMHEEGFDVVDLDPFGTPIPYADAAVRSARTLVAVTATDTAPLCGAHFHSGVRSYSTAPQNTEYHPEMGLRVLVSALVRTAARYDLAATPILSHATRHYARTYLELESGATPADDRIDDLGYVYHCRDCLHRSWERALIADPPGDCPNCDADAVVTAGPIWLGSLHETAFVERVDESVTDEMGTAEKLQDLCDTLAGEVAVPTHYDQHKLCKTWGRPANAMDEFLEDLRSAGHEASRTHYGGTTFKSDASVLEVRTATLGGEE
jgi:tRNA (guanine26-N2/guanine27-N2)-dimethyltransferase